MMSCLIWNYTVCPLKTEQNFFLDILQLTVFHALWIKQVPDLLVLLRVLQNR